MDYCKPYAFDQYEKDAAMLDRKQAGNDENLWYPCLGLSGEVGEVIEHVKKYYRDGTEIKRELIKGELGDVLWYLTTLARRLGLSLQDVAEFNIQKLEDRKKYGKRD